MKERIGFMQGRLSPIIDGRIQTFPWPYWQQEFELASQQDIQLMEWTLDQDRLYENPLLAVEGQNEIKNLCRRYDLRVASLTGDCFMQAPFWKASDSDLQQLQRDFIAVAAACAKVGISMIVVPLVDNGRLENSEQEDTLIRFLESQISFFRQHNLQIIFESDFSPEALKRFIDRLDPHSFGINYDIGNSASLGFYPEQEFAAYGERIYNVHVKDRMLGGTTVPLGTGNADFETVFAALGRISYRGNYILQTARAVGSDHTSVLCRYRDMTATWLQKHHA